jgi:hypothetical protein
MANSPPIWVGSPIFITDNQTITIDPSKLWSDPDGDPIHFTLVSAFSSYTPKEIYQNPDGTITVSLHLGFPAQVDGQYPVSIVGYLSDGHTTMLDAFDLIQNSVFDPIIARDFASYAVPGSFALLQPLVYADVQDREYSSVTVTATAITTLAGTTHPAADPHEFYFEPGATYNSLRVGQVADAEIAFSIRSVQEYQYDGLQHFEDTTRATAVVHVLGTNQAPADGSYSDHVATAVDGAGGSTSYVVFADRLNDAIDGDHVSSPVSGFEIHGGKGDDLLRAGASGGDIRGGDGNDIIFGGPQTHVVKGQGGNDELHLSAAGIAQGGDGDDYVIGSGANDKLFGDAGDDVLSGGAGSDRLTGGLGSDVFAFRPADFTGHEVDTVTDFGSGDKIDLRAFTAPLEIRQSATDRSFFSLDINGDNQSDGALHILSAGTLKPTDFLLGANADLILV